jgi:hypothetical protein
MKRGQRFNSEGNSPDLALTNGNFDKNSGYITFTVANIGSQDATGWQNKDWIRILEVTTDNEEASEIVGGGLSADTALYANPEVDGAKTAYYQKSSDNYALNIEGSSTITGSTGTVYTITAETDIENEPDGSTRYDNHIFLQPSLKAGDELTVVFSGTFEIGKKYMICADDPFYFEDGVGDTIESIESTAANSNNNFVFIGDEADKDTTAPEVKVTGENPVTVELGDTYSDAGATATDDSGPVTVETTGTVDTTTVGVYIITYTSTDPSGNIGTATRVVNVVDTTAPVVTVTGTNPVTIELGGTYTDAGATATDASGDVTVEKTGTVDTNTVGVYTITYTSTDPSDNVGIATRTVNVVDTIAPEVKVTGENPATVELGVTYSDNGATATDLSGPVTVVTTGTVDINTVGTYILTYTSTDPSGNVGTATRVVNVVDTTAPEVKVTGDNPAFVELGDTYNDAGATATDLSGPVTVETTGTVDTNAVGEYTLTYTSTDPSGNVGTATRTVKVIDRTPPKVNVTGDNPATVELGDTYNDAGATATDLSGDVTVVTTGTVNTNIVGSYLITYTCTDDSGNLGTATRTVKVIDRTAPVVTVTSGTDTVELGATWTDAGATATDLSGDVTVETSGTVDTNTVGTYTVTYTSTDPSDNVGTATRTVTVEDTTAPVVTVTGDNPVTVELGGTYTDAGATATDLSGPVTVETTGTVDINTVGTYILTYTSTDPSGNVGTATRTVIVEDTTAPEVKVTGENPVTIELGGTYTDAGATATDLSGPVTVEKTGTVDTNTVGVYTITYISTDPSENVGIATRTVNVVDTTAPEVKVTGENPVTVELGDTYTDAGATATDASGDVTVEKTGTVDTNTVGEYTLTYTSTDPSGNVGTATRTVNVVDRTAPVVTVIGNNPVFDHELGDTYTDAGATATDASGDVTVKTTGTVDINTVGTYILTYTSTDPSGNVGIATRTVNVVDTTAPVVTVIGDNPVTVELGVTYSDNGATALDLSAPVTVKTTGTVDINTVGTYILTYTSTDPSGNVGTATRVVNVVDTTAPEVKVTGENPVTIELGGTYTDSGATATDASGDVTVEKTGTVDTNTVGVYTITYISTDPSENVGIATRTVNVVDTTAPVVTVIGDNPATVDLGDTYNDAGATATDLSGDVTVVTTGTVDTNAVGEYTLTYTSTDPSGNVGTATRSVNVEAPKLAVIITNIDNSTQNVMLRSSANGVLGDIKEYKDTNGNNIVRDNIKEVVIQESVTSIGKQAFEYCSNLQSVTIPDSVTIIGIRAFESCNRLKYVTIGDSVDTIGGSAFNGCIELRSVTIPDSVTSIGDYAFYYCSALHTVTIGDSVTSIGDSAFKECEELRSVTIPDSVTSIGYDAFYECKKMQFVTIGDSVTHIREWTFFRCYALKSVTIGDSVRIIENQAFRQCLALHSVTLPDSLAGIGDYAFKQSTLKIIYVSPNNKMIKNGNLQVGKNKTVGDKQGVTVISILYLNVYVYPKNGRIRNISVKVFDSNNNEITNLNTITNLTNKNGYYKFSFVKPERSTNTYTVETMSIDDSRIIPKVRIKRAQVTFRDDDYVKTVYVGVCSDFLALCKTEIKKILQNSDNEDVKQLTDEQIDELLSEEISIGEDADSTTLFELSLEIYIKAIKGASKDKDNDVENALKTVVENFLNSEEIKTLIIQTAEDKIVNSESNGLSITSKKSIRYNSN